MRRLPRPLQCDAGSARWRCSASAMGAGWIGVSAFVKQAALRPRLQVLRRTRSCRRTSGYCPLWSWHPPLRIEERDDGAKAALLQSFADNGVRPVLRGRIKSNQFPEMGSSAMIARSDLAIFGDLVLALLCRGEIVRVDIFQSNEHPPTLPGAQVAKHEARRIAWTPEAKWPPRRRARR